MAVRPMGQVKLYRAGYNCVLHSSVETMFQCEDIASVRNLMPQNMLKICMVAYIKRSNAHKDNT